MHQILIVVQVLVAIGLIGIVLIQQGRGADAGAAFGSGGSGTIFGARGPASALTRITAGLAVAFFVNSIALAYVARNESNEMRSVVETAPASDTPLSDPAGAVVPPPADSQAAGPASDGVPVPAAAAGSDGDASESVAVPPAAGDSDSSASDAAVVPTAPTGEQSEPASSQN